MVHEREMVSRGGVETESIPRGNPNLVKPDVSKLNLDKIKQDLPKNRLHFDEDTQKWWEAFLNDGGSTATARPPTWILDALRPAKDQPPPQDTSKSDGHQAVCQLIEKEEREAEVSTFI